MASIPELTVKLSYEAAQGGEDLRRRRAVLWVDEHDFAALLIGWGTRGAWCRPVAKNLPADARLVAVNYNWHRQAFGLLFEHTSFVPVPDGQELPWLGRLEVELREEERAVNPDSISGTHHPNLLTQHEIDNRRDRASRPEQLTAAAYELGCRAGAAAERQAQIQRCMALVRAADPFIGKEWAEQLAKEIENDNKAAEAAWNRCAIASLRATAQSQPNTEAVVPDAVVTERLRQRGWEV